MKHIFLTVYFLVLGFGSMAQLPDSLAAALAGQDDTTQIQSLLDRSNAQLYRDPAMASQYAEHAQQIAEEANLPAKIAQSVNQQGTAAWVVGDYALALEKYGDAYRRWEALDDSLGMAKVSNNLGLIYQGLSDYDQALTYFLASLRYFERHGVQERLGTLYNNVGNIHNRMENQAKAEEYYRRAARYFTLAADTNGTSMVFNNLGLALKDQGRGPEALDHYATSLAGYEAIGNIFGQSKVLSNMGTIYIQQERIAEAESIYVRALELSQQINSPYEIAVSQLKLGELYLKTERHREAILWALRSLETGEPTGTLLPLATAHEVLANAYEALGRLDSALFHQRALQALNDSIFSKAKADAISELEIRYDTELKDRVIAEGQQEAELDQWRKLALGGVILGLLLGGGILVAVLRGRIRKEKALKEKDRALAEAEIRAAKAEKLRLQEEIGYKSREITNLAMNIVRRNDLLELLDRELKSLRKGADSTKIKELSLLVSQTLSLEKERQEFQLFVQEAQQNFFHKLEVQHPELSQKDRRLCAMIRLGLSSKEIGAVFNIATNSVEVARYRVRKKLGLESGQGLKEFLAEL
ncbi:MAG: tetratricopeptide repeat protein [Bacteroidota bacterium]